MINGGNTACQSGSDRRKVRVEILSNIRRIRDRLISMMEIVGKIILLVLAQDVVDFAPCAFGVILCIGESTGIMLSLCLPDDLS